MNFLRITVIALFAVLLSSCAPMKTPSSTLIETKPVITIGESTGAPEDHIVFIPANKKFPVNFGLNGNVFNEPSKEKTMVSFKQDMYLYKYWASLDGKTWVNSHKLMKVEPSGGFDASGGRVEVNLNLVN